MQRNNIKMKTRILFICLGNICRSPAAEGIMLHIINNEGMGHLYQVDSAGLGGWHVGELPDPRMRRHGERHGYDFCSRARKFVPEDFDRFNIIVAMDQNNYDEIMSMARTPYDYSKIVTMASYLRHHPTFKSIPDPYYGGDHGFELVISLLEDACKGLFDELQKKGRPF